MATLNRALKDRLKLSDEEFAERCRRMGVKVHRTEIWAYRTGRREPKGARARDLLRVLKKLGVAMTLDDLLAAPHRSAAA